MEVIWTKRAERELDTVFAYIARDSVASAKTLLNRLLEAGGRLESFPQMGREGRVRSTRELVVPGTDYILPYKLRGGKVRILAVLHGARRWPSRF